MHFDVFRIFSQKGSHTHQDEPRTVCTKSDAIGKILKVILCNGEGHE